MALTEEGNLNLMSHPKRRYPIGAELIGENQTHFRVWAPKAREVDLVLDDATEAKLKFCPLTAESGGYFSGAANAGSGARYRFRMNGAENFYPDPASRFQPDGPHGPSCIVDPTKFRWSDGDWAGLKLKGQISVATERPRKEEAISLLSNFAEEPVK